MRKFELWNTLQRTVGEFPEGEEIDLVYLLPADEIEVDENGVRVYEYFDGSNLERIVNDPEFQLPTTELVVTDDYVSLDEWDGHNLTTLGVGNHQQVHKIIELDGGAVDEPLYLINKWSQWQGDIPTGEVVDVDGLKQHLERLGRDVEEYMEMIEGLKVPQSM